MLDVNVLVALAWDSHVHHQIARRWFTDVPDRQWSTCSVTQLGFVRVSSNPRVLPSALSTAEARSALAAMCHHPGHRFVPDDVSVLDADVPVVPGHRQLTDAHLVTIARRSGQRLITFDRGAKDLDGETVELLPSL